MKKNFAASLFVVAFALSASALSAQQTTTEIRNGTVVSAASDRVVIRTTEGELRTVTIPPSTMVNVDGREVAPADLQPGTQINAMIATSNVPERVKTVTVVGEVVNLDGNQVTVALDSGPTKRYTLPPGFQFNVDGRLVGVSDLRTGSRVNGEIVYVAERSTSFNSVQLTGTMPPAAVVPEPPTKLPPTGSNLPLLGMLGLLALAAGFAMRR